MDIAARPKAVFDDGLRIEALLTRIQRGATVRIEAWRKDKWRSGIVLRDAGGNAVPRSAVTGTAVIAAGAKRVSGLTYNLGGARTGAARVNVKPGGLFTVDHVLYQYTGDNAMDATSADITGVYPDPEWKAGDEVEIDDPYFVGILQEGTSIRLARTGERFGPWTLEVVEANRS